MSSPFDCGGLAALSDLGTPQWQELFAALESVQSDFLAKESQFRSADYAWPREALRNWSRVWEYPYVHHHLREEGRRAGRALKVLDVGSGVAFFPFANARLGHEVLCVDHDPVCVRDLQKAIECVDSGPGQVAVRQSGGTDVAVEDGWADVVLSVSVLEHVQDKTALVESMARALRPGGLCVLTMDLDLRGDFEIGPEAHRELHRTISRRFHPEYPVRSVHPRDMLLSTNGPYGFRLPPPARLLRFRTKQWLRGLVGAARRPIYPFELAVEGLVLRRS